MNEEELTKKSEEVLEVIGDLPYFERVLVLEMVRDTSRFLWMADSAKEGAQL